MILIFFFFKQKTAYEMRISDWSSDVCSSDLAGVVGDRAIGHRHVQILADQHALATHVADIVQRLEALGHRCSPFVSFPRKREPIRSEEHTSELQSLMRISYAVFCLNKKKINTILQTITQLTLISVILLNLI